MAIKTKSVVEASKYWIEGATARTARYAAEVAAAGADWEKGAVDAAVNFKAAVSVGDIDKRFAGGVRKAGAAKFVRKVSTVGKDRFRPGVEAGKSDYESGMAPMMDTIAGLTIPVRKMRGDPSNQDRSRLIAEALHKKRLALRAIG